ncbi:11370_t:CDS:2, partial [Racocetra persica]
KKDQAQNNITNQFFDSSNDLDNETSNELQIDKIEESDNIAENIPTNLANVQNPSHVVDKGRPLKQRYLTGHNSAFYKNNSKNNHAETCNN